LARFLKIFFATLIGGLTLVATLNITADPYAMFRETDVAGFNDQKRLKSANARTDKSIILKHRVFDTILLGTSTVETGLDPQSDVLASARAFNAALPFSNIEETASVLRYIARHQAPRHVIVGLDFAAFAMARRANEDYAQSGFSDRSLALIYLQRLFAAETLRDSMTTLRDSVRGKTSPFSKHGNYDPRATGAKIDFRAQFQSSLDAYLTSNYASFRIKPETFDQLREATRDLRNQGVRVDWFISPLHALHLAMIETAGLEPAFEAWKRDVVSLADQIGGVTVWDFAYRNSITMDPVPGTSPGAMEWYWDAAHYNAHAGDLILCRITSCTTRPLPEDFGMTLDRGNIDAALATQRSHGQPHLSDFSPALDRTARALAQNRK
jgi:hypothetical protein